MKKKTHCFLLCFMMSLCMAYAQKPNIWITSDFTGLKVGQPKFKNNGPNASQFNAAGDPDDYNALILYLMHANKFNTAGIVLGSDFNNRSKPAQDVLTTFNNEILPAFQHDVNIWNSPSGPGGYPSASEISSIVMGAHPQTPAFNPNKNYSNFNTLPATVKALVNELKRTKYSRQNPLYVLVWGPLTDPAIAIAHLKANNDMSALERLFIVSHWTSSFNDQFGPLNCIDGLPMNIRRKLGVPNCAEDCQACWYTHDQATKPNARYRFVDVGSAGQTGFFAGARSYFANGGLNGPRAKAFTKSVMGNLYIKSNYIHGGPDGSDAASFLVVMGNYGVKLSDFNDNGNLTVQHETAAINTLKSNTPRILEDLLEISNYGAQDGNPQTKLSFQSPTKTTFKPGEHVSVIVSVDAGSVSNIRLYMNDNFIRQENQPPYEWGGNRDDALLNIAAGTYELKAIGTTPGGTTTATKQITVSTSGSTIVHITKRNAPGFALDGGAGGADGQNIKIWEQNTANVNQQWEEISVGDGYYAYKKMNTNFCIDGGGGGANGQNVKLWNCRVDNQNQHWRKVAVGNAFRLVKRNYDNFSIDGGNGGQNGQTTLLQPSSATNGNQQWLFNAITTTKSASDALSAAKDEPYTTLAVYPNPANSQITLKWDSNGEESNILVSDFVGRFVLGATTQDDEASLDVSSLDSGVYLVTVKNGQHFETVKFIKQ